MLCDGRTANSGCYKFIPLAKMQLTDILRALCYNTM